MSKEKSNIRANDLEKDFANTELALDTAPENYDDGEENRPPKSEEVFQEEFRAVFDEETGVEKKQFAAARPEGAAAGVFDWIRCVIFAVAIVVVVLTFVFRLVEVDGTSMNDTLANRDKVIVTDMFYTPHNNDIVVISHGTKYPNPIIKRVIATEGQTLKLDYDNNKIYVDGVELAEPYIKGTTLAGNRADNQIPDVIPEGKVFVMGDNRPVSLDSRSSEIGLIDVDSIIGKAQFVVFPFDHIGNVYDK